MMAMPRAMLRWRSARAGGPQRALSVLSGISEDLLISTSIGHQIGGASHEQLVDSLVRTNVVDAGSRLEQALRLVDRRDFVPPAYRENEQDAYANRPLKIGVVATISTPQQHAQVLALLEPHLQPGMRAVDVGCGSGILVAAMARLVGREGSVTGIDIVPELVAFSRENLKHSLRDDGALLAATSVIQSDGRATKALGLEAAGGGELFDCLHVGVAVETKAEAEQFLDFLKPGGGLLIPLGFANAEQKLVKMTKHADGSVDKVDVMSVLCQPMLDHAPVEVVKETRAEKLARLEKALADWRDAFEREQGRKPTRTDMTEHPEARELFQQFAALRK